MAFTLADQAQPAPVEQAEAEPSPPTLLEGCKGGQAEAGQPPPQLESGKGGQAEAEPSPPPLESGKGDTGAEGQQKMAEDKLSSWPWGPRLVPEVSHGEQGMGARIMSFLFGERMPPKSEIDQYPTGYFLKQPHSLPSAAHLLWYAVTLTPVLGLGIAFLGWSARLGTTAAGWCLKITGVLLFHMTWAPGTDCWICFSVQGCGSKLTGLFSILTACGLVAGSCIPIGDGNYTGIVFAMLGYLVLVNGAFSAHLLSIRELKRNWKFGLVLAQLMLAVGTIPIYFGYLLFYQLMMVPHLGADLALALMPLGLTLIEQASIKGGHNVLDVKIQRPFYEKLAAKLENPSVSEEEKKRAWAGGDYMLMYDLAVFYQLLVSEVVRLVILLYQSVQEPNAYGSLMLSLSSSLLLNVATRSGWMSCLIAEAFSCCRIGRLFWPNETALFMRQCKKLCGYPRYSGVLAIVMGRLLLSGDLAVSVFATKGLAPVFAVLGCAGFEVVEDVLTHAAVSWWSAVPRKYVEAHPSQTEAPRVEVVRSHAAVAAAIAAMGNVWVANVVVLVFGLEYITGCANNDQALDIMKLTIVWEAAGCM